MTFTQSFTSMLYNVTAVEQSDPTTGVGPAYLLNGISDMDYWYQIGLSYNWDGPVSGGGYVAGFNMNYEVFNSNGVSILPTNGEGGLLAFSGPVNQGDAVALNLYITTPNEVVLLALDYTTGSSAEETYSAEGASEFVGLSQNTANSNGFFTGLMTEWYHASAYYGNEQRVNYLSTYALSSAWMWMDEVECSGTGCSNRTTLFDAYTPSPVSYSNPTQLQEFTSNNATEYSDAYEFITGAVATSQVSLVLSYAIQGGGAGYSPPVLTYVSNGATKTGTLGTSPTTFNVDPGSSWSVNPTLGSSTSSERWATSQATSGTATSSSQTIIFLFYNQYLQTLSYSVSDASAPAAPTFTADAFGSPVGQAISTSPTGFWFDSGASWSVTNPLPESGATERWLASNATGTISSAGALDPLYYHQFLQTLSYSVTGGGSPNAPSATGSQFGSAHSVALTSAATDYWFDATGSVSFNSTIAGATNERWATPTIGVPATSSSVKIVTYFHQYQASFQYSVANGGSPIAPTLTCTQEASSANLALSTSPQPFWCDSESMASATSPAPGSTPAERWSDDNQAFTISVGGGAEIFTYYHQYLVTLSYSIFGGGSPSAPAINETAFGKVSSGTLSSSPSPFWLDSQTTVDLANSLVPSGDSERWVTNETLPIAVGSAINETVGYQHEYYAYIESAKTGGGSVSPASQWFDAASALHLVASSSTGWSLGTWIGSGSGSYSGNATTTDVQVVGAINETAVFYPGLNLSVEPGGSATYSYGSTLGHFSSGQHVLYVPPGTNVTLVANPSSVFYSFGGWAVAHASGKSTIAIVVNAPTTTEATFSYNLITIGALSGAVIAIVAVAVYYRVRIRRGPTPLGSTA